MTFCPLYSWKIIIRDPSLWLLVHKIKHHYFLFYFYFLDYLCSLSLETNGGPNGTTLRPHPTGLCNTCQMSLRFREVVQIFFNVGYLFFLKLCFFWGEWHDRLISARDPAARFADSWRLVAPLRRHLICPLNFVSVFCSSVVRKPHIDSARLRCMLWAALLHHLLTDTILIMQHLHLTPA